MSPTQIQVVLNRLDTIEGKVDDVWRRMAVLDQDRAARQAIEDNSDRVRVKRRDVFSMAASAAAVGGGIASVMWIILQVLLRPH